MKLSLPLYDGVMYIFYHAGSFCCTGIVTTYLVRVFTSLLMLHFYVYDSKCFSLFGTGNRKSSVKEWMRSQAVSSYYYVIHTRNDASRFVSNNVQFNIIAYEYS